MRDDDQFFDWLDKSMGTIIGLLIVVMLAIVGVVLWAIVRMVEHFT